MLVQLTALLAAYGSQPAASLPADRAIPPMPVLPACDLAGVATVFERLADLPPAVRAAIERPFGPRGIAEAGQYFDSNDVVEGFERDLPDARFLRAYRMERLWFVWFELGGMGVMRQTIAFVERRDEATGEMSVGVALGSRFGNDLCAGNKAYLLGARSIG